MKSENHHFDGFSQQSLQSSMYSSGISQLPMFAAGQLLSHLGTRRFGLPSAVLVPCDPHLKTSWHLWHQMVKIHHDIINCWFIIKFIWVMILWWCWDDLWYLWDVYLCKTRGIPCSSFPILVSMDCLDCLRWGNHLQETSAIRKHQEPRVPSETPTILNHQFMAQISPSDFWGPRIQLSDEAPVLPRPKSIWLWVKTLCPWWTSK